jgi:murein L,D-transpeptidase YcbB/YkuD
VKTAIHRRGLNSMLLGICSLSLGCASRGTTPQRAVNRPGPAHDRAAVRKLTRSVQRELPTRLRHMLVSREAIATYAALQLSIAEESAFHETEVLRAAYDENGSRARFVDRAGLNEAGELVLRTLASSDAHALAPRRYHVPELEQLRQSYADDLARQIALPSPLTRAETARLQRVLAARTDIDLSAPEAVVEVVRLIVSPKSPIPRLAEAFTQAKQALQTPLETAARVELLLADGLMRLARDLKRGRLEAAITHAQWQLEDRQADEGTPAQQDQPLVLTDPKAYVHRLLLSDLKRVRDASTLEELLQDLEPTHPQYGPLREALARYRTIAEKGGWPTLRRKRGLRPGRRHRAIAQLKRRLATEGFYDGDIDSRFDASLSQAIRQYQRTHQLDETGRPTGRAFWRSLNVGVERRVQALELTLQRLRESRVGDDSFFVRVNIPDFHLEVWRSGERIARHRVVVGRARERECNERTRRRELAYATPEQSARIETVVFAPHWNVTRDIKEEEYDAKRGMDPLFYQKHGYEVLGSGYNERVRELPGPGNSLGFVKFIFPNRFSTYLHDTPLKQLFQRQIRAFSHGCMRVQHPLKLAELVLSEDDQWNGDYYGQLYRRWRRMSFKSLQTSWDPARYARLKSKASEMEKTVTLRQRIPIHVEYHTVRVDPEGKTHFLADIYRRDRARLYPHLARGRRCVPDSVLARRNFSEALVRVAELEQKAVALATCVAKANALSEQIQTDSGYRTRLLRRRLSRLGELPEQHRNLAQRIRDEHEDLATQLGQRNGRWRKPLVRRALRIRRFVAALAKMTSKAETTCSQAEKATEPPSLSNNSSTAQRETLAAR